MCTLKFRLAVITCTAVLCFAGSSGPALAATTGWMVNGALLSGSKALATTAKTDEKAKLTFGGVAIRCEGETWNSSTPQITSPNRRNSAGLEFTGCAITAGECALAPEDKVIKTVPVSAEATLEGASAARETLTPQTGKVFTTIKYEGSKCALSGIQPVKGSAVISMPTGQTESASQAIKVISASKLEVGGWPATLEGSALLRLASGEPWSFL